LSGLERGRFQKFLFSARGRIGGIVDGGYVPESRDGESRGKRLVLCWGKGLELCVLPVGGGERGVRFRYRGLEVLMGLEGRGLTEKSGRVDGSFITTFSFDVMEEVGCLLRLMVVLLTRVVMERDADEKGGAAWAKVSIRVYLRSRAT